MILRIDWVGNFSFISLERSKIRSKQLCLCGLIYTLFLCFNINSNSIWHIKSCSELKLTGIASSGLELYQVNKRVTFTKLNFVSSVNRIIFGGRKTDQKLQLIKITSHKILFCYKNYDYLVAFGPDEYELWLYVTFPSRKRLFMNTAIERSDLYFKATSRPVEYIVSFKFYDRL